MATVRSAEPAGADPAAGAGAGQSARVQWLAIGAGLLAAWLWVAFALVLGGTLSGESVGALSTLYLLLLFGPLVPIALAAGRVAHIPVLRAGNNRLVWTLAGLGMALAGLAATVAISAINGGLVAGGIARGAAGMVVLS
ncbi:MAG TPA: hypothetical protein PKD92_14015, partial [Novosphingobium sp.]|nr:hypothetical protein [Novosphingobium sp.]